MATLIIDGQSHQIDDKLATDGSSVVEQDNNLRDALRPNFDLAANATFTRVENDGQLTITVLKTPARKGGESDLYLRLVQRLRNLPSEVTLVMTIACEMQALEGNGKLDVDTLIDLRPRIDHALKKGKNDLHRMATARHILSHAPAITSPYVPLSTTQRF